MQCRVFTLCKGSLPYCSPSRARYHRNLPTKNIHAKILCASKSTTNLEDELQKLKKENRELRKKLKELRSTLQLVEEVPEEASVPVTLTEEGIHWPTPNESPPFWTRSPRFEGSVDQDLGSNRHIQMKDELDQKSLYVMHMTAEMAPIAKVGGLADVVTGLARASIARGHNIEVCLPYYECLPNSQIQDLEKETDFDCPKGTICDGKVQISNLKTDVWKGKIAGVQVFLLRPDWSQSNLFKGDRIYGGRCKEIEEYLYFSRACLEFLRVTNRQPHVLHLHEWQTAPVSLLYWERYHHDTLSLPRIIFTIHNLDSSGDCSQEEFNFTGFDLTFPILQLSFALLEGVSGEVFATVDKALDERTIGHNPERLSLLKGALIYSNSVTTVSPTYANEVLDGGAGGWLRGTLGRSDIRSKVNGILNGIDVDEWDPDTDVYLPMNFSNAAPSGKAICKEYLQKGLGLDVDPCKPLVSCVTRLVPQKGIHLIKKGIYLTNDLNGQFVLLGTGHADGDFRAMAESEFKNHPNINESLAHLIYAASDIVLVPSMFEPCGLTQMIAMRYGALPLVRRTGGLADTVQDIRDKPNGNGFSFDGVDEGALTTCLTQAMDLYRINGNQWKQVSESNMNLDFSWDASV